VAALNQVLFSIKEEEGGNAAAGSEGFAAKADGFVAMKAREQPRAKIKSGLIRKSQDGQRGRPNLPIQP